MTDEEIIMPEPEPERIYVNISGDGRLEGFYSNKIHSVIPDTAMEISAELRAEIISKTSPLRIKDRTLPITTDNLEEIEEDIDIPISPIEQLRADVDFLMIMEGYADV